MDPALPPLRPPPGALRDEPCAALATVPPGLREQVLQGSVEWTVPPGRLLLPQGQRADVCYGLVTGMLRLHREGAQGQPVILDLLEPGRWVGCTHVLADSPLPFGVATLARSTLLVLRKSTLQDLLESRPVETAGWIAKAAAAQDDGLAAQLGVLATGSVEERIRGLLHLLADRFSRPVGGGRRIIVPLTQSQIGCIVGASRQRVNTTLGVLQRLGRLRIVAGWMELAED